MEVSKEIASLLLQIKAIKLNPQKPFIWASGLLSPIYCDNRVLLSHVEARNRIQRAFIDHMNDFSPFDGIAGVATAGIAHGAMMADRTGLPFIYVRSQAKSHGRQNLIEGELRPGASYLVVEDLISTGGSSLKAVEAVREAGAKVAGVIAIFSYEFPETESAFAAAGCLFKTLTQYDRLLEAAVESGYITNQEAALLRAWRQDPKAWSESRKTGQS